jgi:SulP family sulfate permease
MNANTRYANLKRLETVDEHELLQKLNYGKVGKVKKTHFQKFEQNWPAGLTVGLINLPLYISLGVAARAPCFAAVLSAIISGLFSGWLGGSNYNVVGPSPAIAGYLAMGVLKYGYGILPYYAMITGVFTFLAARFNFHNNIDLFPLVVNKGFTLGVAITAFSNQTNFAWGIMVDISKRDLSQGFTLVHMFIESWSYRHTWNPLSPVVYFSFLIALLVLVRQIPKVPWMLVLSFLAIGLGYLDIGVQTLESRMAGFTMSLFDISYLHSHPPTILLDPRVWIETLPIAFTAILETLISAKVADGMTGTRFNKYREMRGLWLSNFFSGLLGSFPVAGALSRTFLNLRSGANHKYSAIINAVTVFILGYVFIGFYQKMPLAVVGAMVSCVAIRLVDFDEITNMAKTDKKNFSVFMAIAILCVVKDTVHAIVLGILFYLLNFCNHLTTSWTEILMKHSNNTSLETVEVNNYNKDVDDVHDIPETEHDYIFYRMIGFLNYLNVNEHIDKLKALASRERTSLIISLKYINYIDSEALQALKILVDTIQAEIAKLSDNSGMQKKILIVGIRGKKKRKMFKTTEWFEYMSKKGVLVIEDEEPTPTPRP